jgi:CubicO group peptidase (beta-lactamase class C family)
VEVCVAPDQGRRGGDGWAELIRSPLDDAPPPGHRRTALRLAAGLLVVIGAVVVVFVIGRGDDPAPGASGTPEAAGPVDSAGGSSTSIEVSSTVSTTTTSEPQTTTTSEPQTTTSPTSAAGDAVEELAAFVDELVLLDRFSGVVLIARDDEVVWALAAGQAEREAGIPNRMDTRFNLGSMNKMFTAVAILQLMEEGLLALDGTVAEYLPGYPNEEVAARVTIDHLLTHTSGLGDVFTEEFGADPHRYRTTEDWVPLFVDEPLLFAPGERFSYSNAGYVVLGLIIEELSGSTYDEYLREHVFEPAAMTATGFPDVEEAAPDLAVGYTTFDIDGNDTGALSVHTALMPGRGFAAGGGYSTAGDLHRFGAALFGDRLLSPESVDLLTTGKVTVRDQAMYAYGFFDRVQAGRRVVGHGGGAPGVCSSLSIYPETGYTAVVLSNSDSDCLAVLEQLAVQPPG